VSRPSRDPLLILAAQRRALIENKSRDFAAERAPACQWPAEATYVRSLATGKPQRMRSRADFNADERAYAARTLLANYRSARREAMMPPTLYDLAFREIRISIRGRKSPPSFNFEQLANALMVRDQNGIAQALGMTP